MEIEAQRETEWTNKAAIIDAMIDKMEEHGVDMLDMRETLHKALKLLEKEKAGAVKEFE
jgi:hypothetical protein